MQNTWSITAFYKFLHIADVEAVRQSLFDAGTDHQLCGLLLVAHEGINGTVAGTKESIDAFKTLITERFGSVIFKDSTTAEKPFKRWKVTIREEIVAIGNPDMHPDSDMNHHLSPEEWNRVMDEEDVVVIDARNTYETAIGMFKGAIDPQTETFQEFPDFVKHSGIPKDKKVLMYCTGGIRCEKAILAMQEEGYKNVYQLQGGILNYLEQCPSEKFEGECFVFDHRVAVDQDLKPSQRYTLCVHCGNPGDLRGACHVCSKDSVICQGCQQSGKMIACSKDCAHRKVKVLSL
ncbi:hypothetical protein K8942_01370 [Candidatus Peribacteria bacterium]|nr:MAG: hypothetical protein K8942_01370 [Candidatus Peribacteria bacterium]